MVELVSDSDQSDNPRMQQRPERRKHPRRSVSLRCRIEGTSVAGAMQLTNLSESGCFIAASEAVPVGTEVTVLVTVAGTEIPIVGRVVRVQQGRGFAVEINEQWRKYLRDLFDLAIDVGAHS